MNQQQINHDVALKCSADVADTIRRNMKLAASESGMAQVALGGAAAALASAVGAFAAAYDETPDSEVLDALWQDIIRPLTLSSCAGDPCEFDKLLASIPKQGEGGR